MSDSARLYYRVMGHGADTIIAIHGGPGLDLETIANDFAVLAAEAHSDFLRPARRRKVDAAHGHDRRSLPRVRSRTSRSCGGISASRG